MRTLFTGWFSEQIPPQKGFSTIGLQPSSFRILHSNGDAESRHEVSCHPAPGNRLSILQIIELTQDSNMIDV